MLKETSPRVAIYCRISRDPTGLRDKVQAQEKACRDWAAERNFTLIGDPSVARPGGEPAAFIDNHASALWGARPKWQQLLALAATGQLDGIVVWHTDRLYRRTRDLESLIETLDAHRLQVYTVAHDVPLDLSSPTGRMVARQLAVVAQYEGEHSGERREVANQRRFDDGRPHVGRRWFGYLPGNHELHPSEADLLREVAKQLLAPRGERWSLAQAARWLSEQEGMADWREGRPDGYRVAPQTLRGWLINPRYAGVLMRTDMKTRRATSTFRGHPPEAQVRKGKWEPLFSESEHKGLKQLLEDPKRQSPGAKGKSLLAGLIRCSNEGCEAFLHAASTTYRCNRKSGCGNGTVSRAAVEAYVLDAVVAVIADPTLVLRRSEKPEDAERRRLLTLEIAEVEQRLRDEPSELIRRGVPTDGVLMAVDALNTRLSLCREELAQLPDASTTQRVPPAITEEAFRAAPVEMQAPVVRHLVREVLLRPYRNTGNRFDESRVEIWWHGGERPDLGKPAAPVVGLRRARLSRVPRVTRDGEVVKQLYSRPRPAGYRK